MRGRALAAGASLMLTLTAVAQGPVETARRRVEAADYRMSGRLVRVDGSGARTSYAVNIRAHWFPGALRVVLEVASPPEARVHVLLETKPGEKSSIQIAHPGDAGMAALPFEKWSDGPLGAGFSYEDLLEGEYLWAGQTALGDAKFGARDCDVLKSTPGPADRSHYSEVKSWLDHASSFPVHEEKTLKGSGNVKEFNYFGLRQTEGVWSASQVEVKMRGHAGSMLLILDRGTPKAHLELKDFSPAQISRF